MSGALLTIDSPGLELIIPAIILLAAVLPFLRHATRLQVVTLVVLPLVLTAGFGYFKYTIDSRNQSSRIALLASSPGQTQLSPITAIIKPITIGISTFISERILPHHPDSEKFRGFSSQSHCSPQFS